jgi:hypothetical protein
MGAKDRRARVDSRKIELRVNQHALSVRVPQGSVVEVTGLLPPCRALARSMAGGNGAFLYSSFYLELSPQ